MIGPDYGAFRENLTLLVRSYESTRPSLQKIEADVSAVMRKCAVPVEPGHVMHGIVAGISISLLALKKSDAV